MTNDEIMAAFVRPPVFPADAIALASERRNEIAPLLLAEIEDCAAGRRSHIEGFYYLPDIACHLLAEWRDTRSFRPILSLLATPHHEMLGDSITESMSAILARTYDGESGPLDALILDQSADEFVREAALCAYPLLVLDGKVSREDARAFLLHVFATLPHEVDFVWNGWIDAVAELQLEDLLPQVRQMFVEGLTEMSYYDIEEFEERYASCGNTPYKPSQLAYESPIEEMRRWQYGVEDKPLALDEEMVESLALSAFDGIPAVNEYRDVGRNDPCPCGSGRKFKKCCLPKVEAGLLSFRS